ncbi:MAG: glycosyltransferase family 39 protein [Proteobacteria bacterium]|nr:glycosyltransferase family 39 protein [Pseudomonadota bacterium]MCP4915407.1 glycosyltransferase family 39 protein [Pseudomonadota bacterium]
MTRARHAPGLLAALVGVAFVLWNLDAPLIEDGLFWWVPKALRLTETGPSLVIDVLPEAARPGFTLPPQWEGGLPDYAHPPLWYMYLAIFLLLPVKTHVAVHLAALPIAVLFGTGMAALLRRLGGPQAAWAAAAFVLIPPVAAQLLRPDTDLPLMALTPWALVFILDRRDGMFALVAGVATACKEPGILLAAPAVIACLVDRRKGWGWLAPPLVLAGWAGLHYAATGWGLASSERLPDSFLGWLSDLGTVAWIVLGEQGRWLVIPAAIWGLTKAPRRRGLLIVLAHVVVQIGFFGTLNFLGGLDRLDAHTHVRYLIPGMLGALALAVALFPLNAVAVAILGVIFLHRPSPHGPESSLYGLDVARAVRDAEIPADAWVGSYAWTQLTRPYAGVVDTPRDDLRVYRFGTDPAEIDGPIVEVCEGEPLGRLQELQLDEVARFEVHHAWVRVLERR